MLFINADIGQQSPDGLAEKVRDFKAFAKDEFGREVQIWTNAYIVQGDTEQDANDFLHHYVNEKGDWEAAQNLVDGLVGNSLSFAEETLHIMKFHFIAGWAGYPIVSVRKSPGQVWLSGLVGEARGAALRATCPSDLRPEYGFPAV